MDDQELVLEVAGEMLAEMGFQVAVANDGRHAVELYRSAMEKGNGFDLVLMDLHVPGGMGGKEAVKAILAIDPSASVLVSSGSGEDPAIASPASFGFQGVVIKPYTYVQLRQMMRKAMQTRSMAGIRPGDQP